MGERDGASDLGRRRRHLRVGPLHCAVLGGRGEAVRRRPLRPEARLRRFQRQRRGRGSGTSRAYRYFGVRDRLPRRRRRSRNATCPKAVLALLPPQQGGRGARVNEEHLDPRLYI